MSRRSIRTLAALLGLSVVVAACGGDDKTSTDDAAVEQDPTTTTEPGFTLDEPLTVVAVISDPGGTDENAVPDFNDGIRMAVDEINTAGGVGGHDVSFEAVETLAVGDSIANSLSLALKKEPDVLLGPVSSTAVLAMAERVDADGVPMIHHTTEPKVVTGGEAGSPWIFGNRPRNDETAAIGARYAVEELDAEKVGQMYVNTAFGQEGNKAQDGVLDEFDIEVVGDRSFDFNATDLTEAVLAMKDADVILDWGTPNTLGLAVNTLAQQGMADTPHIGGPSVGFGFFADLVGDDSLLEGVLGVIDCNPAGDERDSAKQWRQRFVDEFDYEPSYASAEMYDSVYLVKHVVEQAESADAESIRDGLAALDGFDEGVCAVEYRNDNNVLHHEAVVAQYEDGTLATRKFYDDLK